MRKAIIKEVSELTENELELLLKDDHLQDDIMEYVYNTELLYIDDMLYYIEPSLSDYNITPYDYSYMKVSNLTGFIYGVNDLNNDYNLLDDDVLETLKLAIETSDIHDSVEIGSDDYYNTMDSIKLYIGKIVDYLISEFVDILTYYDSFETVYNTSDYVDHYLENLYDRDCLVDNNNVTLI